MSIRSIITLTAIIGFICPLMFMSACSSKSRVPSETIQIARNGKPFYPLVLNYMATLQASKNDLWGASAYQEDWKPLYTTKDSCHLQLESNFRLIRSMGFNTIRLSGIGEYVIHDKSNGVFEVHAYRHNMEDTIIRLDNKRSIEQYFNAINDVLEIAKKADLQVIMLTRMSLEAPATEQMLEKFTRRFKDQSAVLAYDLFNEPLYFDSVEHQKKDIYRATLRWKQIVHENAPEQYMTIGLVGIREVFEWDPALVNCDFLSFHPYAFYSATDVENELYWYKENVNRPWMLGETGLAADNNMVTYDQQLAFARSTIKRNMQCGGIGYSWWQYKDVVWRDYHQRFLGIMRIEGSTYVEGAELKSLGSPKPVVQAFKEFKLRSDCDCPMLDNYYNYVDHKDFYLKGRLVDQDGAPVSGGVIMAWDHSWTKVLHTISRPDGTFILKSNHKLYHWVASACSYTARKGDLNPDRGLVNYNGVPTLEMNDIRIDFIYLEDL